MGPVFVCPFVNNAILLHLANQLNANLMFLFCLIATLFNKWFLPIKGYSVIFHM